MCTPHLLLSNRLKQNSPYIYIYMGWERGTGLIQLADSLKLVSHNSQSVQINRVGGLTC